VLWKKTVNGVEYRLSAIPLGGYVMIPDVDPEGTKRLEGGDSSNDSPRERIPAWKEVVVAVAGPAMNIVLAAVIAIALSVAPGARFGELPATIGAVVEGGPADMAGIKPGDTVLSVGGRVVSTWTDMQTEVQISGGRLVEFAVSRPEIGELKFSVLPARNEVTGAYFIKAFSVTNESGSVSWMPSRNPLRQLAWDAGSIFRVLKGLVTPGEAKATAGALGGPVMIAEGIYASLRRNVWDGLGFLRFLNVNLAVVNLLPIPVLDGGLILFSLIALVFRRRVPDKIVSALSVGFMYALMALMALLIAKDSMRSWRMHSASAPVVQADGAEQEGESDARD
ncbi:MAG: site-2 protease family protein, partial [Kiritimatiellae bacterium]|nr:site-2 protease family protein [Kiritimatiellia bacterium]